MAVSFLKTPGSVPDYTTRVLLSGREYLLVFGWNARASAWFLDVFDQDGQPIVYGLRLVVDYPLGRLVTDSRWLAGLLFAVDNRGQGQDPGFAELGDQVRLAYGED
jgi:hypothetical protein